MWKSPKGSFGGLFQFLSSSFEEVIPGCVLSVRRRARTTPTSLTSLTRFTTTEDPGTDLAMALTERKAPVDRHPVRVYLLRLAPSSRPVMRGALQIAAELLTASRFTWETMPWAALRIQHMDALRAELADRYAPATANRMLPAVRGVLRAAWELGLMDLVPAGRLHQVGAR